MYSSAVRWLTSTPGYNRDTIVDHELRTVALPGLQLRFVRGPGPLAVDPPLLATLRASSRPRAFLENLSTTHPATRGRNLPQARVEERLEAILHLEGEDALGALRDRARAIAMGLAGGARSIASIGSSGSCAVRAPAG